MTSATPVVDNDYRKHQPTMMKKHTILEPGPYLDSVKRECVVLSVGPRMNRALLSDSEGVIVHRYTINDEDLAEYTRMDHWPEWWPFQDAALPERTPQIGDWVRRSSWRPDVHPDLIVGNYHGRWQFVGGDGHATSATSLDGFTVVPAPEGVGE